MGAGIAVEFKKKFRLASLERINIEDRLTGSCVLYNRVFNLITKAKYHGKPTYTTLHLALISMSLSVIKEEVKFIAMPKIGCGLDRLQWGKVRELIKDVFKNIDVEIRVCHL